MDASGYLTERPGRSEHAGGGSAQESEADKSILGSLAIRLRAI